MPAMAAVSYPVVPGPARESPLPGYTEGAFFFSSPYGSVLGEGIAAHVGPGRWAEAGAAALREVDGEVADPIVVGTVGFAPDTAPRLVVPRSARHGRPPRWLPDVPAPGPAEAWTIRPVPEPAEFERTVAAVLAAIDDGRVRKVVLARSLELAGAGHVRVPDLLRRLADRNACGHVFAADVTVADDPAPRTLVGASPELLVSRHGTEVVSNPLAGSAPRHADPLADRACASALFRSAKDRHEHALVVEDVAGRLKPFCAELHVPAEPVLVRTAAMWHLSTRITATLRTPAAPALELAQALHPTPAVGGLPVAAAVDMIGEVEAFDRGYYTGLVGWTDAAGDGEWSIVLRCAEVCGSRLRLFAGGGVVAGSEPAAELAETSAKFRTFLSVLGLEGAL